MEPIDLLQSLDFDINDNTNRYYNKDGISVPRVTEILSEMIHSDTLMIWSNSLGLRGLKYKTELNRAASYGTQAHACIEVYLRDKIRNDSNTPFLGYLLWENVLLGKGLSVTPLLIEEKLSCQWFGGTVDAVLDISGKIYPIDFKTSNHVTFKYFLQLAAYVYMLSLKGINPDGIIVLQLDKKCPGFNEYLLDFHNPEHAQFMNYCTQAFFSLVYAYYQIKRVETNYKQLF